GGAQAQFQIPNPTRSPLHCSASAIEIAFFPASAPLPPHAAPKNAASPPALLFLRRAYASPSCPTNSPQLAAPFDSQSGMSESMDQGLHPAARLFSGTLPTISSPSHPDNRANRSRAIAIPVFRSRAPNNSKTSKPDVPAVHNFLSTLPEYPSAFRSTFPENQSAASRNIL